MWRKIPFTDVFVNEFGMCAYTDYKGDFRRDNGYTNKAGYRVIKLGHKKFFYIHRLVARAFVQNPCPNYFTVVHHKDKNRENNAASNLEWTTVQMNNAQRKRMKLTKKCRKGFRVQFIFDKKVINRFKLFPTKEDAIVAANLIKSKLIDEKRQHFINCEKNGENPYPKLCPTCGNPCTNTQL